jgi:class 3 adenylate cyclase/predicted ATPase
MDIAAWLCELGLERYQQVLRDNDVDAKVLPHLTAEDLKDIGITSVGHRRRLLAAIEALRAEGATPEPREPSATAPPAPEPSREAERRQLTVMFVDLVGSTALSARLDPEDVGEVIRSYQERCGEVASRWDGHIAKYMGDGVLAYFGWPQAHEDDAERAVRAGLELAQEVERLTTTDGVPLAARIGIATGLVMVGDLVGEGAAQEQRVVGDTPNLAARLQALADPGTVVIAEGTRRLLGDLFEYLDLGRPELKGFAKPVRAWRVVGETRAESRFEALHGQHLTALVGREHEIGLLMERWERAKEGEGQVVLLAGEPGIGKSRIVRALRERLADEPHTPLSHYCSPHHTNSALYPVIGLLERAAGFGRDDRPDTRLDKLEALLARGTETPGEAVPLVATLIGLETGERYPAPALSPQRQKQRTLEVLIEQVEGLAVRQPVLAVYEDVHWIDPTTLEALGLLIERVQRLPVLVLITFRPEFSPPWTGHAHVMQLSLSRLTRRHGQALVAAVTGGKALPDEVLDQILAKTDGVPLFVEELTKAVLESDLLRDAGDRYALAGPLAPLAIPATLQDSLMARLDRLAPVKEVAQIGAVIGREFAHELVAAVSPLPADRLGDALDQLVAAELVFRRGTPPEATYSFKHALVQDAAYQSLLKSTRHLLHARIAKALEQRFPDTAPEVLAHHLSEAQLYEQAVPKWLAAGQAATARSAYAEAAANLRCGLDVVGQIADASRQIGEEIRLQNALGFALIAHGRVTDAVKAYERARSLCRQVDVPRELFAARFGLFFLSHLRLDLEGTAKFSSELLAMVEGESDSGLVLEAHHAGWSAGWPRGELEDALAHAAVGIDLYVPETHHALANVYGGHDPGICARYTHGIVSWLLGFPDEAAQGVEDALALAREFQHPLTLAVALTFACHVRQFRRETKSVGELGRQNFAYSTEQGFRVYAPQSSALEGWALAAEGRIQEGMEQVRAGLGSLRAIGADVRRSYFLGLRAEVCLWAGQHDAGLEAVSEALNLVETHGERWWEAELYRLQGELLLTSAGNGEARACARFERALDISRQQKAKSLELRAATSLARLRAKQGKRAQAHDLLAPIYDWFTEGFDTADLKAAKALLDELA